MELPTLVYVAQERCTPTQVLTLPRPVNWPSTRPWHDTVVLSTLPHTFAIVPIVACLRGDYESKCNPLEFYTYAAIIVLSTIASCCWHYAHEPSGAGCCNGKHDEVVSLTVKADIIHPRRWLWYCDYGLALVWFAWDAYLATQTSVLLLCVVVTLNIVVASLNHLVVIYPFSLPYQLSANCI
jgi:hypothetical protein